MASRFIGGVSMTERSRTPARDIWSVRGISVALIARVSIPADICFSRSVDDAEALLLVHDQEPEVLKDDVLGRDPVRADQDVHLPCATRARTSFVSDGGRGG
jgi:hypothetical protein